VLLCHLILLLTIAALFPFSVQLLEAYLVDAQTEGQQWVHAWQSWMRAYFARQPPLSDAEQRALLMTEEEAAAEAEAAKAEADAKAETGGSAQA
jgi:hypothetical protein